MINIEITKKQENILCVECSGHADFADYGKPAKIVKLFGGKDQYEQAVKELEESLYEMEIG